MGGEQVPCWLRLEVQLHKLFRMSPTAWMSIRWLGSLGIRSMCKSVLQVWNVQIYGLFPKQYSRKYHCSFTKLHIKWNLLINLIIIPFWIYKFRSIVVDRIPCVHQSAMMCSIVAHYLFLIHVLYICDHLMFKREQLCAIFFYVCMIILQDINSKEEFSIVEIWRSSFFWHLFDTLEHFVVVVEHLNLNFDSLVMVKLWLIVVCCGVLDNY